MIKVDLHMHSYHSDGTLNCKELINELLEKDIQMFSLTDHDTIAGLDEMKNALKSVALDFIPGVEIATTYKGKEFHLTTYGFDANHPALNALLKSNLEIRRQFDIDIMTYIDSLNKYDVSLEAFLSFEDIAHHGGWPSINYLKHNKIIETLGDYFMITKNYDQQMTFPEPESIIEICHQAGASVFLAHPSSNQKGGLDIEVLDYFMNAGIDGLECYSPYNQSEHEAKRYVDYCNKNELKISGGSDYHGAFVGRTLGLPEINNSMISYNFFKAMIHKEEEMS